MWGDKFSYFSIIICTDGYIEKIDNTVVFDDNINDTSKEILITQTGFYNISTRYYTSNDNDRFVYITIDDKTIARSKVNGITLTQNLNVSTFVKKGSKIKFVSNDTTNVRFIDGYVIRTLECF